MESTAVQGELLTPKELGARLKMKDYSVRQMARDGSLPGIKVGSDWRFSWDEVVAHLRNLTAQHLQKEGA